MLYFLSSVCSVLMWYFAYSKRKAISDVLFQIYNYKKQYKSSKRKRSYITPLLIFILLFPYITCVVIQLMVNFETEKLTFWTFQFEVRNKILKRIILLVGNISFFSLTTGFPFYLTFALNVLFYRCSEVLSIYNVVLQVQLRTTTIGNIELFKVFFDMIKMVKKLNEAVKTLSFLIISLSLGGIFSVLLSMSVNESFNTGYKRMVIFFSPICSIMFVSYTICSSMISENLVRIKCTVREFINGCRFSQLSDKQILFYLNRIESEEIIYISACGLFNLKRSLILSALGAVMTYGLLITSL